jgi:hypothetical protein
MGMYYFYAIYNMNMMEKRIAPEKTEKKYQKKIPGNINA